MSLLNVITAAIIRTDGSSILLPIAMFVDKTFVQNAHLTTRGLLLIVILVWAVGMSLVCHAQLRQRSKC